MVDVKSKIIIEKNISIVSEYAGNPEKATTWYDNIKLSERLTPEPLGLGSKILFQAEFLKRKLEYVYEIIEYIPMEKQVMRTDQGPFPMETTYTWDEIDTDKTIMTLRNRGKPKGFSKFFAPLMSIMMKKENIKDLKKLKSILETE